MITRQERRAARKLEQNSRGSSADSARGNGDADAGFALLHQGREQDALALALRLVAAKETPDSRALFVACMRGWSYFPGAEKVRDTLVTALRDAWGRPRHLVNISVGILQRTDAFAAAFQRSRAAWPRRLPARDLLGPAGLATIAGDALFNALIETVTIRNQDVERFLTLLRYAVIEAAATPGAEFNPRVLATAAALARQCLLNEYVFDVADADAALLERLTASVTSTLATGDPVSATHVAALAAYAPLASVPGCEALLRQTWPRPVVAVLQQQLREPAEEAALRAAIPRLTTIDDDVSRDVREHYEQNPYPRWVSADTNQTPVALADYLRAEFPAAAMQPFGDAGRLDILVAGCGTGQQVVELSHRFSGAKILAIDLSLASLAYAARKTAASGIANVEFGQADILQLGAFERTFDAIVSTGVLHHLADPLGAWRILLRLLRPAGVMLVGLYSEAARRPVVAARALIAARGQRAVPEDIRRARQELWALPDADPAKRVTRMSDFYSTSECRDLLFHEHEIRLTLPAIRDFIRDNGLTFIGFELDARNLQKFRQRFPDEASLADLDCWDAFEADNPDTFVGMYQFWVQKPGTDDAGKP